MTPPPRNPSTDPTPADEPGLDPSEAGFRGLVEGAPDGIFTQHDGRFAYLNPLARALFGCTSDDQLVGRPVLERVDPRFHAQAAERIRILRDERRALEPLEYQLVRLDGSRFWAEISAIPHRVNGVDGALAFVRDVTERKRTEDKLARAEKMEALGTLAGGIAHDFNNLLVAIIGNTELAQSELPPEHPTQRSLTEVLHASERAADLVRRILAFSRRHELMRTVVEVGAVVSEGARMLERTLPARIAFAVELADDAPPVVADASQLHQVLLNLVTNSAHAIGPRTGRIVARLSRASVAAGERVAPAELATGEYAVLSVIDDGNGIAPDVMDRIFDPFFTTKRPGEGTGLGLATSLGIVRSHGGAIAVESEPGQGASFHVWLPAAPAARERPRRAVPARADLPLGSGERVLFVDDEEAIAQLAERALVKLGYRPATFTSAVAALEAFQAEPAAFAAVVSDLSMPLMSGLELLRAVRAARGDVPLLLTSGYLQPADLAEAEALGVSAVLAKPTRIQELASALAAALAGGR